MKKKALVLMMIMFFVFMPRVEAICNLKYDDYTEESIEHAYVIGEYVFNLDTGYSPSLEDIAHAARTIPEGKEEYIYDIYNISDLNGEYEYEKWEVLDSEFDGNKKNLSIDVSYEYWANIRGASEDEYDLFYCQVGADTLDVIYTTLDTVGESEYKTEATRTAQITSTNKISKVEYCITTASECTPDKEATLESDNTIKISYDTNIAGQKVCVKAYDEIGNYTDIICDNQYVLVDKESASLEATEVLGTVIEKEPNGLDELFEITYSVSGGEVDYYYYTEENGIKEKHLLTDLSDLPEGEIEIEAKVTSGNGLVTTETRVITVVKHVVTYDYKTNGGDSSDITEYKASYKGKAKLSEVAYKDGYEFIGWNTDANATTGIDTLVVEGDTTLYAIFKGNIGAEFIVRTKDGSVPATTEYERVECEVYNNVDRCNVTIPMLNAKVGYEAIGWSKTEYNKTAEYIGGETIEIKSKEKYYSVTRDKTGKTVTYNSYRDGEIVQDLIKCYPYNGETSCTVDPSGITSDEYDGREFIKYVDENGNPVPDGEYEITSGKEYYAYYEDVYEIIYKSGINKEEKDEASVRFVIKDTGVEETVEEITVKDPEEIDGWEFTGYRKDAEYGESQLNPGDKIKLKGDVTYSAMYRKPIKVTYELDTGVIGAPENEVGYGYYLSATNEQTNYKLKLAEVEDMSWTGKIFEKWIVNGKEYDPGEEIIIDKDTTVTAKWSVDGCIVYFDYATNGGSSATKTSITYINGDPAIELKDITAYKIGWTFIGWTDKKGATTNALEVYKPEDTQSGDKTLYAMFEKTIRVDFRIQDGNQRFNLPTEERQEFTIYNGETEASVPMPEVDELNNNYEFLGWTKEENGEKVEYEAGQTAKVSNYTIFYTVTKTKKPIISSYHYYDEKGNGAVDEVGCYLYNGETTCETESTVTESTYDDAVLGGWSSNATTVKTSKKQEISKNTDFYGVYDKVITVSYYSGMNKASTSINTTAIQMIVSPSGTTYISPTIVLETPDGISGYQTLGWRKDEVGGEAELKANDTYKLTDSVELYGTYLKNITISYVANGGSPTPESETKKMYYNTSEDSDNVKVGFTLANELTRIGYSFAGWLANNAGEAHEAGSEIELSENTKMYAKWEVKSYKVTYNYESNGGSSVTTKEKETAYLSQVDLTPIAYKEGYEFVGWSTEENSTKVINQLEMPAEAITLYAVYRAPVEATWILTDPAAGTLSTDKTICYKYNEAANCKVSTAQVEVREGYTVTGWTRTQGSLTVEVSNNSQTTLGSKETFYSISRISSPMTGTFYYPINKVDEETGDALEEEEITSKEVSCYRYNGASTCKVSAPVKPTTYQSAIFDGWTHSKTEMTEVEYELTESKNYYSHFTAITEVIYHDGKNNENIIDTNAIQYTLAENGDNADIPAFVLRTPTEFDDYKQIGWTSISDKMTTEEEYKAGEELDGITSYELYALYQRDLTVSYETYGAAESVEDDVQVQTYHSYIGATEHEFTINDEVTKIGYTFIDWGENSLTGAKIKPLTKVNLDDHQEYHAIFEANEYNISYDYNNGAVLSSNPNKGIYDEIINIKSPQKIIVIKGNVNNTDAISTEYITTELTFAGWLMSGGDYTTALQGKNEDSLTNWSDDSILPKVEYYKNLSPVDNADIKMTATWVNKTETLPTVTKTGYTCTWNTKTDGSGIEYESGGIISLDTESEEEIELYAQCEANKYTITYEAEDVALSETTKEVTYDDPYGELPIPEKDGYTFEGWYDSEGNEITKDTIVKITEDSTITAKFTAKKYTVEFETTIGTISKDKIEVTYDEKYGELPTVTETGYTFEGWYNEFGEEITENSIVKITENSTLTAKMTANKYTITYEAEGVTLSETTKEVTFDSEYGQLPEVIRPGYNFLGWYDENNELVQSSTIVDIAKDAKLKAKFEAIKYTASFTTVEGTISYTSKEISYDDEFGELPTASRTGYDFVNWLDSEGNIIKSDTLYKYTENITLTAEWEPKIYVVTFVTEAGTLSQSQKTVVYDKTYGTLPEVDRTGYTFLGWYNSEGNEITKDTMVKITQDSTLTAKWKANQYTITFVAEGITLSETSRVVTYDKTYGTLPDATRTGYTFNGWYDESGNLVTADKVVKITNDCNITASYTINSYKFDTKIGSANYGTITSTPGTYNYNTQLTVTANPGVGYVFAGWYDGSSMMSYEPTYTFNMPAKDLTLEAKFSFDINAISNIKVLNVYPQQGDNLKTWMETNGYGAGKMTVTSVTQDAFGANPEAYLGTSGNWKYDIVVFGFWDANNNTDISAEGSALIEQYILEKNPVLFGHDTIAAVIYGNGVVSESMLQHPNYSKLAKYVNVSVSDSFWLELSPTVTIQKESLFTNYPHQIGQVGTQLTIPQTHVLGQTVLDPNNIFLTFEGISLTGGENFYLTVYENCAFIQTGHSSGQATDDEQKILANTIFYLYAQSIMSKE